MRYLELLAFDPCESECGVGNRNSAQHANRHAIRAKAREEPRHRLRVAERGEQRVDARRGNARKEIVQVHAHHDVPSAMGLDVGQTRMSRAKAVRGAMRGYRIE